MLTDGAESVMEYIRGTSEGGGTNSVTVLLPRERPAASGRQRGKKEVTGEKRKSGTTEKETREREQHSQSQERQPGRPP